MVSDALFRAKNELDEVLFMAPKIELLLLAAKEQFNSGNASYGATLLKQAIISPSLIDKIVTTALMQLQKIDGSEGGAVVRYKLDNNIFDVLFISLTNHGRHVTIHDNAIPNAVVHIVIDDEDIVHDLVNIYRSSGRIDEAVRMVKKWIKQLPVEFLLLELIKDINRDQLYWNKVIQGIREILNDFSSEDLPDVRLALSMEVETRLLYSLITLDYERYNELGDNKQIRDDWIDWNTRLLLLIQMGLVEGAQDRIELMEIQRKWGERSVSVLKKGNIKIHKSRRAYSKARIGIMGGYLGHTGGNRGYVQAFIYPFIQHLNTDRVELFCYSFGGYGSDSMEPYIREKGGRFEQLFACHDDKKAAQTIADDGLDALIEVGTAFYRTGVTVYKPCSKIISWLDYPNSSGLPVDYIVVDPYTMPSDKSFLLESPLIVPQTWVVIDGDRILQAPIALKTPQERNGYITFGSMSITFKITKRVIEVWADIMHMVPNSRFILISPDVKGVLYKNFCMHMQRCGIAQDRISFSEEGRRHIDYCNEIDIALDSFPRTGGTTTCELLWMGVPVVTLVGPMLFERISYSNLSNAGLEDLCAFTEQEYKEVAINLSLDKDRRSYLRQNLRKQIMNNPLGQAKKFTKGLEDAIIAII